MKGKQDQLTKVYMLSYDFNKPGLYCVRSDRKGFNQYRFYDGKLIDDWPEDILFVFDGAPEEDFLLGGLHWDIVSERVRQVFLQEKIQGVQFLPVKVVHNQTGKDLGPHWVLNVYQRVEKLKWRFVYNMDIFRRNTSTFISSSLKRRLEQAGVTSGAGFVRVSDKTLGITETN